MGEVRKIPALNVDGRMVLVNGRFFRVGRVHDEHWLEDNCDDLQSSVQQLRPGGCDVRIDAFAFLQKLPNLTPRRGLFTMPESVAAIPISTYEDWMNNLPRDARTDVRKAAKRGVSVRPAHLDDEFVRGIVSVYNESPIRQGKPFWHHGKDVDVVRRENATYGERSTFLGAYLGSELIGFMKIVRVGRVGAMMQILAKIKYREYRVSNALVASAVRLCSELNWLYLTYGQYRYRNRDSSLTRFKHRTGFREYLLPRYFIPLNRWGDLCLNLGLQRDLADRVPAYVISAISNLRAKYYERLAKPR
jgi:hypothetical protein